ncbi:MAG: MOSC N-terminal beta barrel domain-containing protein [Actinomycetota bacterium]
MSVGVVKSLHIHPIKSCRALSVQSATVGPVGLVGDREWQVAAGITPLTQRQHAVMATVDAVPIDGGLRLSAPGQPTIEVERPSTADTETGSLIGVKVLVGDAGEAAAEWFTALLGDSARLYARTPESELVPPEPLDVFGGQRIAFSDLAPVLVANTASSTWLEERANEPFGIDRFRANVVVDGPEPFAEDTWARFRIGAAALAHGAPWPRCAVPQVDQNSGERRKEPAVVLKAHRWVDAAPAYNEIMRSVIEGNAVFGVGCSIGPAGTVISVGDALEVDETMEPLLASPA